MTTSRTESLNKFNSISLCFTARSSQITLMSVLYAWRKRLAVLRRSIVCIVMVQPLNLTTKTMRCNEVQMDTCICWLATGRYNYGRCNYVIADSLHLMRYNLPWYAVASSHRYIGLVFQRILHAAGAKSSILDYAIKRSCPIVLPLYFVIVVRYP